MSHFLLFPLHNTHSFLPFSLYVVFLMTFLFLALGRALFYDTPKQRISPWKMLLLDILSLPILVLLACYAVYSISDLIQLYFPHTVRLSERLNIYHALSLAELGIFFWIIIRTLLVFKRQPLDTKSFLEKSQE